MDEHFLGQGGAIGQVLPLSQDSVHTHSQVLAASAVIGLGESALQLPTTIRDGLLPYSLSYVCNVAIRNAIENKSCREAAICDGACWLVHDICM